MLSIYSALAGLACAGLWYGTIALSEGAEMSRYVFHCQVLVRLFSGPATEHQEAAYFFIPYVFVFFAPWIFLLLPGIGCGVRHWRTLPPATRYWGIVALSILLVFSIPSCKRFYYIVPMVAPLSLFVSGCMESLGDLPGSRRLLAAQGGVLLVAAAFLMFGIIPDESMGAMFPTVLALALAGGIAMMAIALWSPTERIVPSVAGLAIAGYLAFTVFGLPALNENKSTRLFVQRARALAGPDARLVSFHGPGYALQYEDRSIQSVAELDQMRELLRQGTVYCFVKDIRLAWLKDLSCRPHILLSRNPPFERGELFLRLDPPNR
jgi:4-amino-4-deoxy-L-arabinose transferase-like glycosyltransferase